MIPVRCITSPRHVVLTLVLFATICGGTGCGLPKQWHLLADKLPEATPQDPAYQMLCIWEPAEGVDENGLPSRGFAGKITFFTRRQQTGVRVRGDVMVSVFDDQGPVEKRGQPIRNWEFLGDAWAIHLQDSQIGPAYSVFIPYSRKGNHQAQCALQVRFTPEGGGQPLYSDTVAVLLSGPTGKKDDQPLNVGQTDKRTSLQSITIPLHEKRKARFANVELGKVERHHTVAPVSDLFGQQAARSTPEDPLPQNPMAETEHPMLETLPARPEDFTPQVLPPEPLELDQTAKPISSDNSPGRASFTQVPMAPPAPKHPLLGGDTDDPVGTNPFNR